MEYDLLGAAGGPARRQSLDLGPRKQRALLAVLRLEHPRPVSVDRIVDASGATRLLRAPWRRCSPTYAANLRIGVVGAVDTVEAEVREVVRRPHDHAPG